MAFTYDSKVLRAESVVSLATVFGEEPDFNSAELWTPEDPEAPHGVYMGVVADFMQELLYFPDPEQPVARILFTILPDAPPGTETLLTFDDDSCGEPPVMNAVVFKGHSVPPGVEGTEVRIAYAVNGKVKVLGEVSIFLRGDANTDYSVDLSDAVTVLDYLFGNGTPLTCPDAADANDDGNIDIADPIAILQTLFTPVTRILAPYPETGPDPTPDDSLGRCYY